MVVHRNNSVAIIATVVFLAVFICDVHCQTLLLGSCPSPPMQQNFSAQNLIHGFDKNREISDGYIHLVTIPEFMGRWYEVERSFVMAELGWRCITVDYREEGGRIRVETVGQAVVRRQMTAVATFSPNSPARIILRGEGSLPTQSTNYVLATDYENYAIVWSCRNSEPPIPITGFDFLRNITHTENLWILSRQRSLAPEFKELIYSFLDNHAISRRSLRNVAQENCSSANIPTP